jgi:hypothetical protein
MLHKKIAGDRLQTGKTSTKRQESSLIQLLLPPGEPLTRSGLDGQRDSCSFNFRKGMRCEESNLQQGCCATLPSHLPL